MSDTDFSRAEPSGLSKRAISSIAEGFAKSLSFKRGDDLIDHVRRIGGKVEFQDTLFSDPEQSGSLYVRRHDDFTIIVPLHTSPSRDRFTVAHELGHYVIHYLWKCQSEGLTNFRMKALRKDSDRVEWEANWFAAAFLMPADEFRTRFHSLHGNIDFLADDFGVSRQATDIRVKSLGLT